MFTTWKDWEMDSVWLGKKFNVGEEPPKIAPHWFKAKHIETPTIHPVESQDPSVCTSTGPGLWKDKIMHFLPDRPPSSGGEELHTEFFFPEEVFVKGMNLLFQIRHQFMHVT